MKKLVYVTGAGRGIGRAISLKLAEEGYLVSGSARTLSELEETKELSGDKIRISRVDATDFEKVSQWIDGEAKDTGATPWGLVTAAGIYGAIGAFSENSFQEWKNGIDVNLLAPAFAAQYFIRRLLREKQSGRVVFFSGGGATQPLPNFTNYCAAKSGIVRLAETLALELKDHRISVNSVAPGAIATKFIDDVIQAGPQKAGKAMYEKALKQKEDPGVGPEKAAELVSYLMCEDTGVVTGRLISAIWDPWSEFKENWEKIEKTDWYTLRRSVPPA